MGWTDERVELLKRLWAEGQSASQISKALGGGLSRNAVIGKVHRLGLAGRAKATPPGVKAAAAARAVRTAAIIRPRPPRRTIIALSPQVAPLMPAHAGEVLEPGAPRPLEQPGLTDILGVGTSECKWPIGDPALPGFTLCGRRAEEGSYCGEHTQIAYQPAKKGSSANDLERSLRRYV